MTGTRRVRRFLWQVGEVGIPLLTVLLLAALGLRLLGNLPRLWLQPQVVQFASIEEAERALGSPVWLPVYFPEFLDFPPQAIEVRGEPVPQVMLHFQGRGERGSAWLTITQFTSAQDNLPPEVLAPHLLTGQGVDIGLIRGVMAVEEDSSRIYWQAADRHVLVRSSLPPDELLRIARSLR